MDRDSVAAAIYDRWEIEISKSLKSLIYPIDVIDTMPGLNKDKMREWLITPPEFVFGDNPLEGRDILMAENMAAALELLEEKFGPNMADWTYGKIHMAQIIHPFSHLVSADM